MFGLTAGSGDVLDALEGDDDTQRHEDDRSLPQGVVQHLPVCLGSAVGGVTGGGLVDGHHVAVVDPCSNGLVHVAGGQEGNHERGVVVLLAGLGVAGGDELNLVAVVETDGEGAGGVDGFELLVAFAENRVEDNRVHRALPDPIAGNHVFDVALGQNVRNTFVDLHLYELADVHALLAGVRRLERIQIDLDVVDVGLDGVACREHVPPGFHLGSNVPFADLEAAGQHAVEGLVTNTVLAEPGNQGNVRHQLFADTLVVCHLRTVLLGVEHAHDMGLGLAGDELALVTLVLRAPEGRRLELDWCDLVLDLAEQGGSSSSEVIERNAGDDLTAGHEVTVLAMTVTREDEPNLNGFILTESLEKYRCSATRLDTVLGDLNGVFRVQVEPANAIPSGGRGHGHVVCGHVFRKLDFERLGGGTIGDVEAHGIEEDPVAENIGDIQCGTGAEVADGAQVDFTTGGDPVVFGEVVAVGVEFDTGHLGYSRICILVQREQLGGLVHVRVAGIPYPDFAALEYAGGTSVRRGTEHPEVIVGDGPLDGGGDGGTKVGEGLVCVLTECFTADLEVGDEIAVVVGKVAAIAAFNSGCFETAERIGELGAQRKGSNNGVGRVGASLHVVFVHHGAGVHVHGFHDGSEFLLQIVRGQLVRTGNLHPRTVLVVETF